jgi:outer membrane receptor protein involved in Fe transport
MYKKMRVIIALLMLSFAGSLTAADISVVLKEKGSKEFIIGGTVIIYNAENPQKIVKGGRTNKYGFTALTNLKAGKYILTARSIGYEKHSETLTLKADESLSKKIYLNSKASQTDVVTVTGKKTVGDIKSISKATVSSEYILNMPALGSEVDILRSMQLLPGVSTSSEMSSGLNIRGGTSDQTLYRLDGVTVYNPTHLGGFIGAFNADATHDVELLKGAFPAEYGGRLSGILDLTMKEGSKEKFQGVARASIISASAEIEGPITDDISYMISARRFYFDYLIKAMSTQKSPPSYYFYDLNTKMNWEIDDNNHLFLSGMFSNDILDITSFGDDDAESSDGGIDMDWGNKVANLRYMHIFSPKLFTNFSLIYSTYKLGIDLAFSDEDEGDVASLKINNGIEDVVFRGTADWFGFDNHKIRGGFDITHHKFDIYSLGGANAELFEDLNKTRTPTSMDVAAFIDDEWEITPLLQSSLGLRANYYPDGEYFNVEPRIALSYQFQPDMYIRGAVTNAHQSEHLIRRSDINVPTDVWIPTTDLIKPSESWQYTLGFETELFKDYLFSVEGYYKTMTNLYEYKDTVSMASNAPLEEQLTSGTGKSYGIEFFLHKKFGDFQGWIGYTVSEVLYKFEELNGGKEFHPLHDQLHNFKISGTYNLNKRWEFAASWVYTSGQPITMPSGSYRTGQIDGSGEENGPPHNDDRPEIFSKYNYTKKNNYRMAAYHRLDLNVTYKYEAFKLPWELSLNVYNAYNRQNPFTVYVGENNGRMALKQVTLFGILPTIGISCKF